MRRHGVSAAAAIALAACASHPAPPAPSPAAALAAPSPAAGPAAGSTPAADSSSPPSSNELKRLVAGSWKALQACYAAAVKENPALGGGMVAVKASISPAGEVTVMSTEGPPELQVLDPCIKAVVSALPFPSRLEDRPPQDLLNASNRSLTVPRHHPYQKIRSAFVELNGIEPSASSMPFRGEVKKNE